MPDALQWLALEAKYLDVGREFYGDALNLPVDAADEDEVRFDGGAHQLRVRQPSGVPRGGLHTHFAFATPPDRYDWWWDRLADRFDLVEHRFGEARSLYCYDPDGNCVEIGQRGTGDRPITGIFEVVLEVEDLDTATAFYEDFGFAVVDRGADRKRVRLSGPVDLELWEPHLGIADARGGVHVDLGFADAAPGRAVEPVADRVRDRIALDDGGVRVRDPDGHWLTVERRS